MLKNNMASKSRGSTTKKASTGLEPAPGYIFIEPQEKETRTTSGILLPETASADKPQKGKVLAIGADEVTDYGTRRGSPCKKGDVVIYKRWGGNEVKIGAIEYLFVKFEDILAIENN